MSDRTAPERLSEDAHANAAAAFVEQARSQHGDDIDALYVFGSTVRGDTRGRASDVDILIVLTGDTTRETTAESLRDIALDAMIEHGPAVELHFFSESSFEQYRQEGNPFIHTVITEGQSYA